MTIQVNTTNITIPGSNYSPIQTTAAFGSGKYKMTIYNTPTTWGRPNTTPATVALKWIRITCVGGGGGGAGSWAVNYPTNSYWESYGNPGNVGGTGIGWIPASNLPTGVGYYIIVGSGGSAGVAGPTGGAGGDGGFSGFATSSFTGTNSIISGLGGRGGQVYGPVTPAPTRAYGGPISLSDTGIGFAQHLGYNYDYGSTSAPGVLPGGASWATSITDVAMLGTPGNTSTGYGMPGVSVPYTTAPYPYGTAGSSPGGAGSAGNGYGAYGGGGVTHPYSVSPSSTTPGFPGGAGASGIVIIEEFY